MKLLKQLQFTNQECHRISSESMQSIVWMCEKDPDIAEIVRLLIKNELTTEESAVAGQLQTFIYDLGYDVNWNSCHSAGFMYQLDYFLGNYFFDDAEAHFYERIYNYGLYIWECTNIDEEEPSATPRDFIEKAKANVSTHAQVMNLVKSKANNN